METIKNKEVKVELFNEKQDSISVSKTTKGTYSWDLKIYFNESDEGSEKTISKLKKINEKMKETFKNEETD